MATLTFYAEPEPQTTHCCGSWHLLDGDWLTHLETHEGGDR